MKNARPAFKTGALFLKEVDAVLKKIASGVMAGIMVSVGGCVFLACDVKYVGAVLFSVALLSICYCGYSLYTGKIGFIISSHSREDFSVLLLGLLGNAIGTVICGVAVRYAIPSVGEAAFAACMRRLEDQVFLQTLVRGVFCGILMFLSVYIYREKKTVAGILFCIPVFILSGFEHSIADMFYFAASGMVSVEAFAYVWTVILGNTLGGMLFPVLMTAGRKKPGRET